MNTELPKAQLNARVPMPMRRAIAATSKRSGVSLEMIVGDALRVYYGAETPDGRTRRRMLVQIGRQELEAAGVSLGEEVGEVEREKGFEPSTFTLAKILPETLLKDSGADLRSSVVTVSPHASNVVRLPTLPSIPVVSTTPNVVSISPRQRLACAA